MRKLLLNLAACLTFLGATFTSRGQATTGMDFNRADCNGVMHHLFTNDLDSGNVVILEFFMGGGCLPCITAGHTLEAMKVGLNAAHPGKIRAYVSGFANTMNCATVTSWTYFNGITSTPIDSGAAQVAYYGGFGMPTIVILAGTDHKVIYSSVGFTTSDTLAMKDSIRQFFSPSSVATLGNGLTGSFDLTPNPASSTVHAGLQLTETGELKIELFDIAGKSLGLLYEATVAAGKFSKDLNLPEVPTGMYLVKASLNGHQAILKLSVAR